MISIRDSAATAVLGGFDEEKVVFLKTVKRTAAADGGSDSISSNGTSWMVPATTRTSLVVYDFTR